jgi:NAD(P)-dependent dehydrogenase (short-subunit alcohol dehydrogenase family)
MSNRNIAVIGASGSIGSTFVHHFASDASNNILAFSRTVTDFNLPNVYSDTIDFHDESTIQQAAEAASKSGPLDLVIVATGILHNASMMPEKSIRQLSAENFEKAFLTNTVGPALIAKHFLPLMKRSDRNVFAALSARVGSISDNRLGGWHAYRASKAALNMTLKTISIEMAMRQKNTIVVGLHPGTVDSQLSKPFQGNVPESQLFTPEYSVEKLVSVIDRLTPGDSGKVFAWDGLEIAS